MLGAAMRWGPEGGVGMRALNAAGGPSRRERTPHALGAYKPQSAPRAAPRGCCLPARPARPARAGAPRPGGVAPVSRKQCGKVARAHAGQGSQGFTRQSWRRSRRPGVEQCALKRPSGAASPARARTAIAHRAAAVPPPARAPPSGPCLHHGRASSARQRSMPAVMPALVPRAGHAVARRLAHI